jgi:altronate hydrolase
MASVLRLNDNDNVVIALKPLSQGEIVKTNELTIVIRSTIPVGHKVSINRISKGEPVIKFGQIIGYTSEDIQPGEHVHIQNVTDPVKNWKAQHPLTRDERK